MEVNHRFQALSKICLNNWHYIQQKVVSISEGINFFTGHSGSGKSTVIDAMQIVLYANTDGRGFFNKAATDDSDRNLIEYLRGMVNIGDDNNFSYLRNQNFSTTIVLEFKDTERNTYQCAGVVFDVETVTNEITKLFFWHKGVLAEDGYRTADRTKSTEEIKQWLLRSFVKEDCYYGTHNERFRRLLYDIYLGGLDVEKFPRLFKRAIPFRMNIKLEEFVKEYICMEQDIHIEDMQQSVMEYGRMRRKIEEICQEMERLEGICQQYQLVAQEREKGRQLSYFMEKLEILLKQQFLSQSQEKIKTSQVQLEQTKQEIGKKKEEIKGCQQKRDELFLQINNSSYEQLRRRLEELEAWLENLNRSRESWQRYSEALEVWNTVDSVSSQTLWDIEAFQKGTIDQETLLRLKRALLEAKKEVDREYKDFHAQLREIDQKKKALEEELSRLKQGEKVYPRELEELREELQRQLQEKTGRLIPVEILADLLDIRNKEWGNAVEGYLSNQKLGLLVAPEFAHLAMKAYQSMDSKKYYRYGVVDTEQVCKDKHPVLDGALSEEVKTDKPYVKAYIDFLLGRVVKCKSMEELKSCKIGITSDCVLYHSYRLQHMNPASYTRYAYIGKNSLSQRIRLLQTEIQKLMQKRTPIQEEAEKAKQILGYEALSQEVENYTRLQEDMHKIKRKETEKKKLEQRLQAEEHLETKHIEEEKTALEALIEREEEVLRSRENHRQRLEEGIEAEAKRMVELNKELLDLQQLFVRQQTDEEAFTVFLTENSGIAYEKLQEDCKKKQSQVFDIYERQKEELLKLRSDYLKNYPQRNFELTKESNEQYEELYRRLNCEDLEEYKRRATEQAKTAVLHFKDDFMYKIRSAIKEAMQRKDELNRIITRLDFGKDKYQFYIGKNKGADGEYYDMFMDDSLEINPSDLHIGLDNQLSLFTLEHENTYGAMVNDLINIFIPPVNASMEEMEEAKRNMDKYADYRTYLNFDMQQIIQNEEETIKIRLSKMITKNSGGEGQNPLYVALLASFAQAYKIDLRPGLQRNPTIRLVVLDEAFSKMDAEKVASCISLMRGLGFQAIISATNDKIQNYLETVDKVFVFANPNKRAISIREFERKEFEQLKGDMVEEGV
ncbi:MAG: chromosome segregation protein SMC [Lachnospiraceae bacterium]|nr:chromosome segregation protein SMC [Lachnospiraceae bacterium]